MSVNKVFCCGVDLCECWRRDRQVLAESCLLLTLYTNLLLCWTTICIIVLI